MKEDLFERDEDHLFERGENPFPGICKENRSKPVYESYDTYAPSQPRTPSVSLNLSAIDENDDDEIFFPSYDGIEYSHTVELMEPPTETTSAAPRPVPSDPIERPEDDSAIRVQPSRHVDYLSHDWSMEDLWSSWKHIISKRGAYNNSARLENASWRSWEKKRSNLKTVSPEKVKW
jgi:hypothetical protein